MSKISVSSFVPNSDNRLILDTNILIYLFYPTTSQPFMTDYENLYAKILKNKSILLLPAIQISEFINRCIRFQYSLYKNNLPSGNNFDFKKDYRDTEDYRIHMNSILDIIKNEILPNFVVVNDDFDTMQQDKIYIYGFSYDFNDALLVQIAETQNASIVTHDADFANYESRINYITSNSKLLMFR